MLTRKPRKGDKLDHNANWPYQPEAREPLGVVDHVEGNICHYRKHDGSGSSMFIWWFESDKQHNQNVGIIQ